MMLTWWMSTAAEVFAWCSWLVLLSPTAGADCRTHTKRTLWCSSIHRNWFLQWEAVPTSKLIYFWRLKLKLLKSVSISIKYPSIFTIKNLNILNWFYLFLKNEIYINTRIIVWNSLSFNQILKFIRHLLHF